MHDSTVAVLERVPTGDVDYDTLDTVLTDPRRQLSQRLQLVDVNGDGLDDLSCTSYDEDLRAEAVVFLSPPRLESSVFVQPDIRFSRTGRAQFADVDGDGVTDLLWVDGSVVYVTYGPIEPTLEPVASLDFAITLEDRGDISQIAVADVTGDQVADVVLAGPESVYVLPGDPLR